MGIRFFCPNGHKLNVKEHLAGKAGFCPECGARLIIPLQSTRKSTKELLEQKKYAQTMNPVDPVINPVAPTTNPVDPVINPVSPTTNPVGSEINQIAQTISAQPKTSEISTTEIAKSEKIINPILQDQSVVWYVQVPGGQQYGPLTGQIIHSWLQEHRIEPTMLLWREGWENWLEAKNVFTELEIIPQ